MPGTCLPSLLCPLPDNVPLLLWICLCVSLLIALGCLPHSMTLAAVMTFLGTQRLLHMLCPSGPLAGRAGLYGGAGRRCHLHQGLAPAGHSQEGSGQAAGGCRGLRGSAAPRAGERGAGQGQVGNCKTW